MFETYNPIVVPYEQCIEYYEIPERLHAWNLILVIYDILSIV